MCHSLRESNEAHHLTEILFKVYDKNTKWFYWFLFGKELFYYFQKKIRKNS